MRFENFTSRRISLKEAGKKEKHEYKTQTVLYGVEKKLNIFESEKTFYISIKNEDGKMIGLIQVDEIDSGVVYVKISIPNEAWMLRYGTEALHQFVKCCKERKLYKKLYLQQNNGIIEQYRKERPEEITSGFCVDFKIA